MKKVDIVQRLVSSGKSRIYNYMMKNSTWAVICVHNEDIATAKRYCLPKYGYVEMEFRWRGTAEVCEKALFIPKIVEHEAVSFGSMFEDPTIIVCEENICKDISLTNCDGRLVGEILNEYKIDSISQLNKESIESIFKYRIDVRKRFSSYLMGIYEFDDSPNKVKVRIY